MHFQKGVEVMPNDEIYALKDCFVKALDPLRVYLFGSYAYGTPTEDSDLISTLWLMTVRRICLSL